MLNRMNISCTSRVCALTLFMSLGALAHPTNGFECTNIEQPEQCFNSDGFCEWVFARCVYRCDIHDGLEDCGQIKEGCRWTGSACVSEPVEDFDMLVVDMTIPLDRTVNDVQRPDLIQETGPVDGQTPRDATLVDAEEADDGVPHGAKSSSYAGCQIGTPSPLTYFLILLYFWQRRRKTCW